MALFIGSTVYRGSRYGRLHPLSIERVPAVIDLSHALGWLPAERYRTSPRAKPAALMGFHTPAYVSALHRAEVGGAVDAATRDRHGLGTMSNPVFPEMYRRPATAVGGGLLAAELVARGGVVHNPGGGTHHGMPDRAAGFCYLNEPVLTIQRLLAMGIERVAYVDIDAHHGDGVEAAFPCSDRVRLVSVHEGGRRPFTGLLGDHAGGAAFNLPVPRGFNDTEFAMILHEVILPAVASFRPGAIYLQCGADALAEDPLSRLALSNESHVAALRALRPLAPWMIVGGGGGYNPWTVARCWTQIWAEISRQAVPDRLPPAARAVLARQSWSLSGRPGPDLLTTLRDAPRPGPISDIVRTGVTALQQRIRAVV